MHLHTYIHTYQIEKENNENERRALMTRAAAAAAAAAEEAAAEQKRLMDEMLIRVGFKAPQTAWGLLEIGDDFFFKKIKWTRCEYVSAQRRGLLMCIDVYVNIEICIWVSACYVSAASYVSACFSIRQHTSAYANIRQSASYVSASYVSACFSIRQHTSAYVSIRQHTSECQLCKC